MSGLLGQCWDPRVPIPNKPAASWFLRGISKIDILQTRRISNLQPGKMFSFEGNWKLISIIMSGCTLSTLGLTEKDFEEMLKIKPNLYKLPIVLHCFSVKRCNEFSLMVTR